VSQCQDQMQKMRTGKGFIAALDQSGGSTPKALKLYGIKEDAWTDEEGMYTVVHEMRTRIVTSPAFGGNRILGAILFENTMDRQIGGKYSADYLWDVKGVIPFLKVDKGLAADADGAQLMKPMNDLDALLERARARNVFGTKMRSVIKEANAKGIKAVVEQQFAVAKQIIKAGLVPIIEPEVDIHCPDKKGAEVILKQELAAGLAALPAADRVMFKLTLPDVDDFYADFTKHEKVVRVVALSGGYSRADANAKLARNHGMIASFSRALTEGLTAQQSAAEFDAALDAAIESIYQASIT